MRLFRVALLAVTLVIAGCAEGESLLENSEPPITVETWDVQGHRGARGVRPENTLPSFELALDVGVTTLELDLHLSADGVPVIWHDPEIDSDKCTNGDPALPAVEDEPPVRVLTVDQLQTYICNQNPDKGKYPDQTAERGALTGDSYGIATLAALFEMVAEYSESNDKGAEQRSNASTVQFNVELKRDPRNPETIGDSFDGTTPGEFETAVAAVISDWGYEDRVVVQSFDHRSLWAIHTIVPTVRLAALTRDDVPDFAELAELGASIWSPKYSVLARSRVADARQAGLDVIPWTVNEQDAVCSLLDMGTAGIITDRPDLALAPDGWLAGCSET